MHEHDGYQLHSHEVRAGHLGVPRKPRAAVADVRAIVACLPITGLPHHCPMCGHVPGQWPIGTHHLQVNITCPACQSVVVPLVAVPPGALLEDEPADECEGAPS